jgi:hypothetical protein
MQDYLHRFQLHFHASGAVRMLTHGGSVGPRGKFIHSSSLLNRFATFFELRSEESKSP